MNLEKVSKIKDKTMITIEKNIPIPEYKKVQKYPFEQMEIGDSFFITGVKRNSLESTAYSFGKRKGKKFIAREVEGGVRCWRVE